MIQANSMVQGALRLFKAAGITVYVHWSWFILFWFLVQRPHDYSSQIWNVVEALSIFAIVLMHEFGHSLACRQTGGKADTIILWPLGGVAFVQPPMRPGAVLWSIAAGPLVNVLLVPITYGVWVATAGVGGDLAAFAQWAFIFNLIILIFNMLPIYPLDGGQILHSLLWFVIGYTKALKIAAGIGLAVAVVGGVAALMSGRIWLVIMAVFVGSQAWSGWKQARLLAAHGVR